MKKILFVIVSFLCMVSCVNAKNYSIKELPELSKYNPVYIFGLENDKMTFVGDDYECDAEKDMGCNMYEYDFKGNVTKLNRWSGLGSLGGSPYELSIKEKSGEDYIVQSCWYDESFEEPKTCEVIENLKVRKLIKTDMDLNVLEVYDKTKNETNYVLYDDAGKEVLKLSSNLEVVIPYSKDENSNLGEGEYRIEYEAYPGYNNILIFKNTSTNNFHVVGSNGKEEIITVDVLKKYNLTSDSVLKLQISLSDDKNIYHVDNKILGDSKGVFSSKEYVKAHAVKFGDKYIIVDYIYNENASDNEWHIYENVYDISGKALVNENEFLIINEEIMLDGILVMGNQNGKVVVSDGTSIVLEKSTGIKNIDSISSLDSLVYKGNVYFILKEESKIASYLYDTTAFVLEVTDNIVNKPTDKPVENGSATDKNETVKEYTYEFIKGIKVTFKIDSKNHVSFTIDGDFKLFKEIYIDGKLLNAKNYTVKEGSTIITLTDEYARKLADGKEHSIKVVYSNGKNVTTTFMVEENLENPHTGQAISILSIVGLISLGLYLKKTKKRNVLNKI